MITLSKTGVFYIQNRLMLEEAGQLPQAEVAQRLAEAGLASLSLPLDRERARRGTMAWSILAAHHQGKEEDLLKIRFDALASHDITYVGIIQTARAGGLKAFPVPYVLTNCHNSLCAVGGTINADDQIFGLTAARRYGGIFVPAHQAVIHQYLREMMAGGGRMILASDSHTRYGALGTMGIGEGGPEIAKQLLGKPYELPAPEVIAIYLKGRPAPGVGPQDVALAIIKEVFPTGYVKNKVMEFVGPGIASLPMDFRNGVDVMTTESACLSSIWETDSQVEGWYQTHGRPGDYRRLTPEAVCWYDGMVTVDLDKVEPMIALPFHPSNAWPIREFSRRGREILAMVEAEGREQIENPALALRLTDKLVDGRFKVEQGSIVGCAGGTFDNLCAAASILDGKSIGNGAFSLNIYPASQPVFLELVRNRAIEKLTAAGASVRTAFCGPCFGAGDTPAHEALSIRHATRNFPNREGSKPTQGQLASVALMDARSIAATALNGGLLTPATDLDWVETPTAYHFDAAVYSHRVYQGFDKPLGEEPLRLGPNITDWPKMGPLPENLLLAVTSVIRDPVTTTDELIPSGETSSLRSNPLKLAEFTLSRKDPGYVDRARAVQELEAKRLAFLEKEEAGETLQVALGPFLAENFGNETFRRFLGEISLGSVIFAVKPGDGSAREQAASCQKVLGGQANLAQEYATKRYRSNLINWGMLPLLIEEKDALGLQVGDLLYLPGIRRIVQEGAEEIAAFLARDGKRTALTLKLGELSPEDREIILAGCLINHYAR